MYTTLTCEPVVFTLQCDRTVLTRIRKRELQTVIVISLYDLLTSHLSSLDNIDQGYHNAKDIQQILHRE